MTTRSITMAVCILTLAGCGGAAIETSPEPMAPPVVPQKVTTSVEISETRLQAALAPDEPYWPFHLAELHLAEAAMAEAETALKVSLAIDSAYAPTLSLLSKVYFDAGRHEEAVALLEREARGVGLASLGAGEALKRWEEGAWQLDPADEGGL